MDPKIPTAERRLPDAPRDRRQTVSRNAAADADAKLTYWDRLADRVAAIGGSWGFIFTFLAVLVAWVVLNTGILAHWKDAFDPYPYIFLNLILSMVAALQAPVIMMSQNRQSLKDRIAAANDYEVNLKAELEILRLHEKIDALRIEQLETVQTHQAALIALLDERLGTKPV